MREQIVALALEEPELSPRELAVRLTNEQGYFVSEAAVHCLPKAQDLITSPDYIVVKTADEFRDKTTASNKLWQMDFTYLKVIGAGGFQPDRSPPRCPCARSAAPWSRRPRTLRRWLASILRALARRGSEGHWDLSMTPACRLKYSP